MDVDRELLRKSLEHGECLRCGYQFEKKKLFCPRCHSPNFLALPRAAALVTVAPFVLILGFFVGFDSIGIFDAKAVGVAAAMLLLAVGFALWTLRSASTVRQAKQSLLRQSEASHPNEKTA